MKLNINALFVAASIAATQAQSVTDRIVVTDANCTDLQLVPLDWASTNWAGPCSGQGSCLTFNDTSSVNNTIDNGVCECNEGWTGLSDWVSGEGWDCQVNTAAVSALWGLNLLEILVFGVKSITPIKARYARFITTRQTFRAKGRSYGVTDSRGVLAVFTFYLFCCSSQVIYAIHRIAAPEQRLGFHFLPSILFFTAKLGLYSTNWLFSPALLQAVLRGQKSMERLVRVNDIIALLIALASVALGALPLINYFAYFSNGWVVDYELNSLTWQIYQLGMVGLMLIYGIEAYIVKKKVIHVLDRSYSMSKQKKTLRMKNRLSESQNEITRQAAVQCVIYLLFWVLPILWNKHDYWLPVSWLAMPALGFRVVNSVDSKHGGLKGGDTSKTGGTNGQLTASRNNPSVSDGGSFRRMSQLLNTQQDSMMESFGDMKSSENDFQVISPAAMAPAPPLPAGNPPAPPS